MSLRTFYTIVTEDKEYDNVESFRERERDGFVQFEFYPDERCITQEIIRLDPETRYIPKKSIVEIKTFTARV